MPSLPKGFCDSLYIIVSLIEENDLQNFFYLVKQPSLEQLLGKSWAVLITELSAPLSCSNKGLLDLEVSICSNRLFLFRTRSWFWDKWIAWRWFCWLQKEEFASWIGQTWNYCWYKRYLAIEKSSPEFKIKESIKSRKIIYTCKQCWKKERGWLYE